MPEGETSQVAAKHGLLIFSLKADLAERCLLGNFFRAVSAVSVVNIFLLFAPYNKH